MSYKSYSVHDYALPREGWGKYCSSVCLVTQEQKLQSVQIENLACKKCINWHLL